MPESLVPASILRRAQFQPAARAALELEPRVLNALADLVSASASFHPAEAPVRETAARVEKTEPELSSALSIFELLYWRRVELNLSDDALEEALAALAHEVGVLDVSERLAPLSAILSRKTELDREQAKAVASAMVPALVRVQVFPDLRMATDPKGDHVGYAPVLMVRLEFDEPIFGHSSIVFQTDEDIAQELEKALEKARGHLERARADLGEKML